MPEVAPRTWSVGALCRAVADALDARFNPVTVLGEISGFSRAPSGHCYFSLKDQAGQLRCVMFKRAFGLVDFSPQEGELVEVRGRLGVYEPRGDLQLIVEAMNQAGPGALFAQFLRLKARLEAEGLFDAGRKRGIPPFPRGIGVVTSLGAAALRDVISALGRRAPHVPVVVAGASVQGAMAPAEVSRALTSLYRLASQSDVEAANPARGDLARSTWPVLDVILLVRGGGSMEDLWAFNDEALARVITQSPVPVVSGIGHETDFTIADFVADLRAPTPTAAAELVAQPRDALISVLATLQARIREAVARRMEAGAQRLDSSGLRLSRPSAPVAVQRVALDAIVRRRRLAVHAVLRQKARDLELLDQDMRKLRLQVIERARERLERAQARLGLLDPSLVLRRGYAWLVDQHGRTVNSPEQVGVGQSVRATVAGGSIDLVVATPT